MEHSKDIWEMVSSSGQKRHLVSPCHFLFKNLSLVSMAFREISHIKVLIFKGILALQSFFIRKIWIFYKQVRIDRLNREDAIFIPEPFWFVLLLRHCKDKLNL